MPPKTKKSAAPAVVAEAQPAITPEEAKKLVKLLKASDRGKRLDAIRIVSEKYAYITSGGCLLPLLESMVPKKKMEEVVKAAGQVVTDYLIGRDGGGDPAKATDTTLSAMQEAGKKPSKYKLADVLSNLLLDSDRGNSWNAVRSLRAMAAVVASLPVESPQASSMGATLLGSGQPVERLCSYLISQETQQTAREGAEGAGGRNAGKKGARASRADAAAALPWTTTRIYVVEALGVMCGVQGEAVHNLLASGVVPLLLKTLRSITASDYPDLRLLTSILAVLFYVAKAGDSGYDSPAGGGEVEATTTAAGGEPTAALAALAANGAWDAVYDVLKGPCMARAAELHKSSASGKKGKYGNFSDDLAECSDNMARCAEVLRVMATTSSSEIKQEGALEAGVATMGSILAMPGLPRREAAVANLMTTVAKALGSIACMSEGNRVMVCSTGAAAEVLTLMAYPDASATGANAPQRDTPNGQLMRKTAEKCLHHLVVSRATWLVDDRALCDTSADDTSPARPIDDSRAMGIEDDPGKPSEGGGAERVPSARRGSGGHRGNRGGNSDHAEILPPPSLGPAYLTVDAVLAIANANSTDVRCRAMRMLSRLASSRRCASALGVSAVPALERLVAWWLRAKDYPSEAHPVKRPSAAIPPPKKSAGMKEGGKSAMAAAATATSKEERPAVDEASLVMEELAVSKHLDESDSTRVLRDEALAYALNTMLEVARTGPDERAAVGAETVVELLTDLLKRLPCTPDDFFSNKVASPSSTTTNGDKSGDQVLNKTPGDAARPAISTADRSEDKAIITPAPITVKFGVDNAGPVPPDPGQKAPRGRSDMSLDLSPTRASQRSCRSPRHLYCWRGENCRDPRVALFSPLDWRWDFRMDFAHKPVQPGLVLRAAALRILLAVADGYSPSIETAAVESDVGTMTISKAAGAAARSVTQESDTSGLKAARSVLKHAMTVCVDLLAVDVCHGIGDAGNSAAINHGVSIDDNQSAEQAQAGTKTGESSRACVFDGEAAPLMVEAVLGSLVPPSEELVHEEIRLVCLRLLGSLLRLGGIARKAFLLSMIDDTHRNRPGVILQQEEMGGPRSQPTTATASLVESDGKGDRGARRDSSGAGSGESWIEPSTFLCWDFCTRYGPRSFRTDALPYVRAVSVFLQPLRSSDASVTNITAALVGLRRLCQEGEHEAGGTQPVLPHPGDGASPLLTSKKGTAGALVDTLAGVAVSVGALVPLIAIWGCITAAGGGAVGNSNGLPTETEEMMRDCQGLTKYLIRRGHSRETFWSSLPSLEQLAEAKAMAAEAAAPKKTQRKSKAVAKRSKNEREQERARRLTKGGKNEEEQECTRRPPAPPAGRPDPNLGPNRAIWGQLLNARTDEERTAIQGTTALLMATTVGLETVVSDLLQVGADPNVRGSDGRSALMCALTQGMDDVVRGLVEAGADVEAVDLKGFSVLKCAFLCPLREAMQSIKQRPEIEKGGLEVVTEASFFNGKPMHGPNSGRHRSTPDPFSIRSASFEGRYRNRTRKGSFSTSRSRSQSLSGSLPNERRRSSLNRHVSCRENSARAAVRSYGRGKSAGPLKNPREIRVVRGDARMVPYILACGADPNVSSGSEDFPLHWAVTGSEMTVTIMKQRVRIISGGDYENMVKSTGSTSALMGNGEDTEINAPVGDQGSDKISRLRGRLSLLEVLVKAGSALDACNPQGMTALHAAVIAGRETLAGVLLDAGASPNVLDSLGCLPLHYACLRCAKGYTDLARRLIDLGMGRRLDRGIHRDDRKGKTRQENLKLDVESIMRKGLMEAIAPSSITHHRATRSELLNFVSMEGFTPFHFICGGLTAGQRAATELLDMTSAVDRRAVEISGGGVKLPDSGTDRVGMLKWLLSEPDLDTKVRLPRGGTALHLVAQASGALGVDLVQTLIKTEGVNIDALDAPVSIDRKLATHIFRNDSSPLHHNRRLSLLNTSETKVDCRDTPLRFSALHYSLQAGSWEAAALLISAGANIQPEGAFPSCLHVACLEGAPASLLKQLLNIGEETTKTFKEVAQNPGESSNNSTAEIGGEHGVVTPLFLAAIVGSTEIIYLLISKYEATDLGVGCPSRFWSTKHSPMDGRCPLHAAAIGGHTAAVRALLDAEVRYGIEMSSSWLNTLDATGQTPLDLAVTAGQWECAEVLAAAEAFDVALATRGGASSTLITAERANMAIVDEGLVKASAQTALRKSNAVITALLKRLPAARTYEDSTEMGAIVAPVSGDQAEGSTTRAIDINAAGATTELAEESTDTLLQTQFMEEKDSDEPGHKQPLPRRPLTFIRHLHPCFAKGVLYSTSKGIFIPEVYPPRRNSNRRSSYANEWEEAAAAVENEERHRAAVVIQSRARQAGAKKIAATERRNKNDLPPSPSLTAANRKQPR